MLQFLQSFYYIKVVFRSWTARFPWRESVSHEPAKPRSYYGRHMWTTNCRSKEFGLLTELWQAHVLLAVLI